MSGVGAENVPMGLYVFEVDDRSSRPNGIFEYAYSRPIFSPIYDPQPCTWSNGTWRRPLIDCGYVLVDCDNRYDLVEEEERDKAMPYEGPDMYPIGVVLLLIYDKTLVPSDCKLSVTATRSLHPLGFRKNNFTLQDCIVEAARNDDIHHRLLESIAKPDKYSHDDWLQVIIQNRRRRQLLR